MTADTLVRHDWSYGGLQRISRMAAHLASYKAYDPQDFAEKVDIAMLACVELLWASDEPPIRDDLLYQAACAVRAHVQREVQVHGKTRFGDQAERHAMYWDDRSAGAEPATERIVERIALPEVFYALSERDQHILWTRAMFPTARAAAAALGVHESSFSTAFTLARSRALLLWFDEETPISWEGKKDFRKRTTVALHARQTQRRRIREGVTGRRLVKTK